MSKPLTYDWNGHTDMPISYPHLTDFQMAGKVRMLMRTDLDHEGVVCGARDRIMGLSKLVDKQRALIETLVKALEPFALISTEGVVKRDAEYSTVTTVTEYFHEASYALAAAKEIAA